MVRGDYNDNCDKIEINGIYVRLYNDLIFIFGGVSIIFDIMNFINKELKLKDKVSGVIIVYKR